MMKLNRGDQIKSTAWEPEIVDIQHSISASTQNLTARELGVRAARQNTAHAHVLFNQNYVNNVLMCTVIVDTKWVCDVRASDELCESVVIVVGIVNCCELW